MKTYETKFPAVKILHTLWSFSQLFDNNYNYPIKLLESQNVNYYYNYFRVTYECTRNDSNPDFKQKTVFLSPTISPNYLFKKQ